MLTLERVRLVNWHNFEDVVVEIGNRCLLAGDNGSGKSTIIDAIQYALAANLRMAKFNSAADERKGGGRDLMGYVRCKLGSEDTEYRRGDTIAHVMLEWVNDTGGRGGAGGAVSADPQLKELVSIPDGYNALFGIAFGNAAAPDGTEKELKMTLA